jgi:hypothetical protein
MFEKAFPVMITGVINKNIYSSKKSLSILLISYALLLATATLYSYLSVVLAADKM